MIEESFEQKLLREWEEFKQERNERLHRFVVKIVVIFALLGLTVAASVYYVYTTSNTNKDALCAMRYDAERRVELAEEFLRDNPDGIPGLSIDSLRRSTNNAKQTAKALSSIDCPPAEELLDTLPSTSPKESPIP